MKTQIIKELASFLITQKKWWLAPIIILLLLLGIILYSELTGLSPFIYTLF